MSDLSVSPRLPELDDAQDVQSLHDYLVRERNALLRELRELRRHVANLLDRPVLRLSKTASQTLTNSATWYTVTWDVVETDTHGGWQKDADDTWRPPVAGWYQVNYCVRSDGLADGKLLAARVYRKTDGLYQVVVNSCAANDTPSAMLSVLIYLDGETDYLEFKAWQNSGGAADIRGAADKLDSWVTIIRVLDQPSVR